MQLKVDPLLIAYIYADYKNLFSGYVWRRNMQYVSIV